MSVSEQGPNLELNFSVLLLSMPNTSSITQHYPTALALMAAFPLSLSRSLSESLMPAEPENRMGHEGGVREGESSHSADVKCKVGLTFSMQNISQV